MGNGTPVISFNVSKGYMKKDIGTIKMGLTFAGCFLGAGYVSGKELWQYFGSYGAIGFAGLFLAVLLLVVITAVIMWIVLKSGKEAMDDIISPWDSPFIKGFFSWVGIFLFFSIGAIMTAGIGGLFVSLLRVPAWVGCLIVSALGAFVAYKGLEGMVAVFSKSVPFLVAATIIISVARLISIGPPGIDFSEVSVNPMLGPWPLSAVNYMALNIYGSIALLGPLAKKVNGGLRNAIGGAAIGGAGLLIMAVLIMLSVAGTPGVVDEELPMLMVAKTVGPLALWVYGVLIFLAMFGVTQSSMVAVVSNLEIKRIITGRKKLIFVCVLGTLNFLASLLGFSNLVRHVYPVFGYVELVSVVFLLINAVKLKKAG